LLAFTLIADLKYIFDDWLTLKTSYNFLIKNIRLLPISLYQNLIKHPKIPPKLKNDILNLIPYSK